MDTTGVSYYLQQLINNANERLVLISPFLKVNERIKQSLQDKEKLQIDIRIIYGKKKLQPEEIHWLKPLQSIRTSFCKNLHAKCYLNEKEAIITSMNLYDFSQMKSVFARHNKMLQRIRMWFEIIITFMDYGLSIWTKVFRYFYSGRFLIRPVFKEAQAQR